MTLRATPPPEAARPARRRGGLVAWSVSIAAHGAALAGVVALGFGPDAPPTPVMTVDVVMANEASATPGAPTGARETAAGSPSAGDATGGPPKEDASVAAAPPPPAPPIARAEPVPPHEPEPAEPPESMERVAPPPTREVRLEKPVEKVEDDAPPPNLEARLQEPVERVEKDAPPPVRERRRVQPPEPLEQRAAATPAVAIAVPEPATIAKVAPPPRPRPDVPRIAPPPRPKPETPVLAATKNNAVTAVETVRRPEPKPRDLAKPDHVLATDVGDKAPAEPRDAELTLASATPADTPPPGADAAPGGALSGELSLPSLGGGLGNRPPRYPEIAREHGWQGRVLLRVQVDSQGRTGDVAIKRSSGHNVLDRAALAAVRDWRFNPARRAGRPVPGAVDVPISFRLRN